jgi:hypothetical protein
VSIRNLDFKRVDNRERGRRCGLDRHGNAVDQGPDQPRARTLGKREPARVCASWLGLLDVARIGHALTLADDAIRVKR